MAYEYTWEFYVAVGLGVVGVILIGVLIFFLFNPMSNVFDRRGGFFSKKSAPVQYDVPKSRNVSDSVR